MSQDQMFIGFGPMKDAFNYSTETQANVDSKIGSAAEHLHSNNVGTVRPLLSEAFSPKTHSFQTPWMIEV